EALLDQPSGPATVGDLRVAAAKTGDGSLQQPGTHPLTPGNASEGVDPELFWTLAEKFGGQVEIYWRRATQENKNAGLERSGQDCRGLMDVVLRPDAARFRRPWSLAQARRTQRAKLRAERKKRRLGLSSSWPAHQGRPLDLPDPKPASAPESSSVQVAPVEDQGTLRIERYANHPLQMAAARQTVGQLREYLQQRLPEYMVPSRLVVVPEIPRTNHGKLDRQALQQQLTHSSTSWSAQYQPPQTPEEILVAEVWEQLLGLSPIGRQDNFFELGGHSMLAVRMIVEIERRTGRRIPLIALFQQATVAHLARLLQQPSDCPPESSLVPLQLKGAKKPFFLVHPAGGTVFCYQALVQYLAADRPVYGLQAVGLDGVRPPHETVQDMVAHYLAAIRSVQPNGPYLLGGWSLGGNLAFAMASQLAQEGEPVELLALFDSGVLPPDREPTEEDFLPIIMALFPGEDDMTLERLRQMTPQEHF
ncbi:MAG TPA: thioesterase domain-containing protein, partial [Thermoguttaceae bacterium]|nr:thioesterase domain-containing protein [Thermoguttaceae bacterium]